MTRRAYKAKLVMQILNIYNYYFHIWDLRLVSWRVQTGKQKPKYLRQRGSDYISDELAEKSNSVYECTPEVSTSRKLLLT